MSDKIIFDEFRKINGKLTIKQVNAINKIINQVGYDILLEALNLEGNTMILTEDKLKKIYPSANIKFVEPINKYISKYDINTKERLAMFLAQTLHESGGFNRLVESLAYTPQRLQAIFPNRFKTVADAKVVVDKGQVAVADSIYGGRYGNVKGTRDAYNYRGRGLLHLTFKDNYKDAYNKIVKDGYDKDFFNIVAKPEMVTDNPDAAILTALVYWRDRKLNSYADRKDINGATKVVNGGLNGIADRTAIYNRALREL